MDRCNVGVGDCPTNKWGGLTLNCIETYGRLQLDSSTRSSMMWGIWGDCKLRGI